MPHGRCTRNSARSAPLSANGGAASANSRWEESCGTRVLCHAALGAASLGFVEAGLQPSVQFIFVAQALLPGALRVPHAPVLRVGLYLCGIGTPACVCGCPMRRFARGVLSLWDRHSLPVRLRVPHAPVCVWGSIFVAQALLPVRLRVSHAPVLCGALSLWHRHSCL